MKLISFLIVVIIATTNANPLESTSLKPQPFQNLAECSKGPVFWCKNVINAKRCRAVDFCISAIWETHKTEDDSSTICDDCKEWVGKARKYLEATSDDLIKSLKWTCDKIPLNSLEETCEHLVEENIPEIIKMLESAMDPVTVCTKLFFCNNVELTKAVTTSQLLPLTCSQCHNIGSTIEKNIQLMNRDGLLEIILGICGEMSSYSDSCSSIVMTNFEEIYKLVGEKLKRTAICESAGVCNQQQTKDIVITNFHTADPGIPCKLCEQAVLHLREVFVANTSEVEFKNVLVGFCHQAGSFSNECINITYEYSDIIYKYLVDHLNANQACVLLNICPRNSSDRVMKMPTMPMILLDHSIQLEDSSIALYKNGSWCSTCEYFVRIIKQSLEKNSTEDEIVNEMKKACNELPKKIQGECEALVELYGDAMMSIIDQNIKPENICPKIKLCPPNLQLNSLEADEKPTCPFCLFAIQEIRDIVATNMTKQNIESVVEKLCFHLSDKLVGQCTEFVKAYSDEVIEMLLADFTPQESCIFIKLCTDNKTEYHHARIGNLDVGFESEDKSENKAVMISNPQCQLCKEVIKIVENRVINKKSKEEIRRELENSCERLKKFSTKCKHFVDKYSDQIVDLIAEELKPEEVCHQLMFCVSSDEIDSQDYDSGLEIFMMTEIEDNNEIEEMPQCVMCEFVMKKIDDELNDKKNDKKLENIVRHICSSMPNTIAKSCNQFVDYYFNMILVFIETIEPSEACKEMRLCPAPKYKSVMVEEIQQDIYKCAICKGVVEGLNEIFEDPYTETNFENMEEKLCEKFVGKYKSKCHDIVKNYGVAIVNLMKTITESDQICYQLALCSMTDGSEVTGMVKLT